MPIVVADIDNPIGEVTTKNEGSSIKSADVNIRSGSVGVSGIDGTVDIDGTVSISNTVDIDGIVDVRSGTIGVSAVEGTVAIDGSVNVTTVDSIVDVDGIVDIRSGSMGISAIENTVDINGTVNVTTVDSIVDVDVKSGTLRVSGGNIVVDSVSSTVDIDGIVDVRSGTLGVTGGTIDTITNTVDVDGIVDVRSGSMGISAINSTVDIDITNPVGSVTTTVSGGVTTLNVDIDNNPIGTVTVKEEPCGNCKSLDTNIRSGSIGVSGVTVISPTEDRTTKYTKDYTIKELSCTDTAWTDFYTVSSSADIYFQEIIMKFKNDHIVRVLIGEHVVLEDNISDLIDFEMPIDMSVHFKYVNLGISSFLRLHLGNFKGNELKIQQKRRIVGTGDLRMEGFLLTYQEILG